MENIVPDHHTSEPENSQYPMFLMLYGIVAVISCFIVYSLFAVCFYKLKDFCSKLTIDGHTNTQVRPVPLVQSRYNRHTDVKYPNSFHRNTYRRASSIPSDDRVSIPSVEFSFPDDSSENHLSLETQQMNNLSDRRWYSEFVPALETGGASGYQINYHTRELANRSNNRDDSFIPDTMKTIENSSGYTCGSKKVDDILKYNYFTTTENPSHYSCGSKNDEDIEEYDYYATTTTTESLSGFSCSFKEVVEDVEEFNYNTEEVSESSSNHMLDSIEDASENCYETDVLETASKLGFSPENSYGSENDLQSSCGLESGPSSECSSENYSLRVEHSNVSSTS